MTIRAYGAQKYFRDRLVKSLNTYTRAGRVYYDLNRWVAFRIDCFGALFAGTVTSYIVYGSHLTPSQIGFTLTVTLAFCRQILSWVRVYNILEVECKFQHRYRIRHFTDQTGHNR